MSGRRILVTGGSQGIGRAVARTVASAGAQVVAAARGEEAVRATVAELPGDGHRGVVLDVARETSWESAINEIGRPLHGLVAAAAVLPPVGPPDAHAPEEFLDTVRINLYGTFLGIT
ncbi:MAG TPA: SDR family NAD(P)-dependent oxidoreductase, partial [Solirubrobacteraceae bacterium]|nr:SDR family NAD(P)-dependent oxidoreductase [Solirubrobacteraceae bacterium]